MFSQITPAPCNPLIPPPSSAWNRRFSYFTRQGTPKAAIYNRYLRTAGGGERSSLEFARALEDLGFEITFITALGTEVDLPKLASLFGIRARSKWQIVQLEERDLRAFCADNGVQVFINHTFGSYVSTNVPHSVYLLMFPHCIDRRQLETLFSYRSIFCISSFSALYARLRWDPDLNMQIVPPPISDQHLNNLVLQKEKQKLILNIGRFNVDGHSKCQSEAILSFLRLQEQGILDPDWRMLVAGHLNQGQENLDYFNYCANLAPEKVSVLKDIPFKELTELYRRASMLFQFTGADLDFGVVPERCEHLGLVAMDALCYGTVPVVYERSGAAQINDWGDNIYSFNNFEELASCVQCFAQDFGTASHAAQMRRCRAQAQRYSYAQFRAKVESVLLN